MMGRRDDHNGELRCIGVLLAVRNELPVNGYTGRNSEIKGSSRIEI